MKLQWACPDLQQAHHAHAWWKKTITVSELTIGHGTVVSILSLIE